MKKTTIIMIALFAFNSLLIKAQTNKGKVLIGASSNIGLAGSGSDLMSIGFSSVKEKNDVNGVIDSETQRSTNINLIPKVGYFLADNFAVGLDLNLGFSSNSSEDSDVKFTQTIVSAGPFARYYIPGTTVLPFLEVNGAIGRINNKIDFGGNNNPEDNISNLTTFGGGAGIAAPLGEKVTLDVSVGYYSTTIKDKEDNPNNDRTVIGTLGLKFGFTVFLGSN